MDKGPADDGRPDARYRLPVAPGRPIDVLLRRGRPSRGPARRIAFAGGRRSGGAARPQRQRQEHAAALPAGPIACRRRACGGAGRPLPALAAARPGPLRRPTCRSRRLRSRSRPWPTCCGWGGRRTGARSGWNRQRDVEAVRRGEPVARAGRPAAAADGRAVRRAAAARLRRPLPGAGAAGAAAGRAEHLPGPAAPGGTVPAAAQAGRREPARRADGVARPEPVGGRRRPACPARRRRRRRGGAAGRGARPGVAGPGVRRADGARRRGRRARGRCASRNGDVNGVESFLFELRRGQLGRAGAGLDVGKPNAALRAYR